jgi:hypothetical protein
MSVDDSITHSGRRLSQPSGWVLYLAHAQPERLIVFVHGFRGRAVDTWQRFPDSGQTRDWWRTSDMLFVAYDSGRDNITATATRVRNALPSFYPELPTDLLHVDGALVRSLPTAPYRALNLVGHSLGGVVLRLALLDSVKCWLEARELHPQAPRPVLLNAELRLFSPASAGVRFAGPAGMAQAMGVVWPAVNMWLRRSSAYTDLQPDSPILADTRRLTEQYLADLGAEIRALRARILWANPDDVVIAHGYDTDYVADISDGKNHAEVCKPDDAYVAPRIFVEAGGLS